MMLDLDATLSVAFAAVDRAEEEILKVFTGARLDSVEKPDNTPVTKADTAAERVMRETISATFPEHGFIGEEEGSSDATYQWVIDPIDGTKNFLRGGPIFGTQLALWENGMCVLAVSNAPVLGERLYAVKGRGAFSCVRDGDDVRLAVSRVQTLEDAYVTHGGLKHFIVNERSDALLDLAPSIRQMRGHGDFWMYHFVASGKVDVAVEAKVSVWDVAAAALLVEEAGGRVTDLDGQSIGPETASMLATNGLLHDELLEEFSR